MGIKETLQQALNKPYSLPFFSKSVLQQVFGSNLTMHSSALPMPVNPSEERMVKWIRKYGEIKLTDYRQVDLYEVGLETSIIVERNKVSIGNVVKKLIAGNNAVLANFYYPDEPDRSWRFSFIAKDQIIEGGEAKKVETNPKRYTYILGTHERCRTAAERFEKLSLYIEFDVEKLKEAFSVEKLSKKFFDEYKEHYDLFVKHLSKRETKAHIFNGDEKAVRDFAKKLLGRIVFLYFVQKKGWLGASDEKWHDGNTNFMEDLFNSSGKRETFYPLWLRTLFYDSLNNPARTANNFKLPTGKTVKVPYLNGGLYEDDDPKGTLTFPPSLFEELFYFFNQYNFTIYEDSPDDHTVAVDPEMLGHIFENLLEDNKDKGAYYTPKEIVHYMCQESLIEFLATKLEISESISYQELGTDQTQMFGNEVKKGQLDILQEHKIESPGITRNDVEQFIKYKRTTPQILKHANEINTFLDDVKICDPAIGSGAFPMGLLHEIFNAKQVLRELSDIQALQNVNNAEIKENIIQNSIYGVDIEKGAVDIARLRFWLSLIVDEELPRPLPNLDFKIVVGNSLLPMLEDEVVDIDWGRYEEIDSNKTVYAKMRSDLQALVKEQKQYFSVKNEKEKAKLKQEIRELKIEILLNQLQLDRIKYQSQNTTNEELFGGTKKSKEKELAIQMKLAGFGTLIKKLEHLKKHPNKPLQFFDWKLDFPEILNPSIVSSSVGFDIVIGNPPYGAEYSSENRAFFVNNYLSAKTIPKIQKGSLDTFTLFIEKGYNCLKINSNLHFIVPISITSSDSMAGIHNLLEQNCSEIRVSSYSVRPQPVFENAVVNTSILFFKKTNKTCTKILSTKMYRKNNDFNLAHLLKNIQFTNVLGYTLLGRYPKIGSKIEKDILDKIFAKEITLRDVIKDDGKPIYYRTTGGRYFKIITNYSTGSTKEKPIYFDKEIANVIGAILSSNLFFWWYQIFSNNLDLKSYEIESFKIPENILKSQWTHKLEITYKDYLEDIERNVKTRETTQYANIDSFKEYKIGKSKKYIDAIDDIICPLYGLTKEESDFIKNYEIEFRISAVE